MPRVLLYEPMLHGHRSVLLRYYCRAIEQAGYATEVCTDMLPEHQSPDLVESLDRRAKAANCDIIHVLTFERLGPIWLKYHRSLRRQGRPIIASYYLYNNLCGYFRGLPWDVLLGRRLLDRLLVSDDFLNERSMPGWRRHHIDYVPDPWDPKEFLPITRQAARSLLCLPQAAKILLVFGALKPRKGLELLFDAVLSQEKTGDRFLVVLAGVLDPYYRTGMAAAKIAQLQVKGLIRIDDGFVEEGNISAYFHAADFVVCPYPKSFQASSNVYTRACAAGTLAIVPDHGVLGELVRRTGAGITFKSESMEDLARSLRTAVELQPGARLDGLLAAGCRLAESKRIECFDLAVQNSYRKITARK
jgi:glycosyltransferase involved in cell wall biosynthesis